MRARKALLCVLHCAWSLTAPVSVAGASGLMAQGAPTAPSQANAPGNSQPPATAPSAASEKTDETEKPVAPSRDPAFDILSFEIEGNTVLSTRQIERVVTPFLGLKRHFADVEGARKALEDTYQRAGYQTVFVDIPEQRIVGGVIRLHVLEGKVGKSRVTGARYFEPGEIRAGSAQLASGAVPNFNEMQKELAQINKDPDMQAAPVLTPGRVPGTVDVSFSVKDSLPLHGDIEDDDYASPFTSPDRATASLHYDNLWQRQHSFALSYQLAPQKPSETNVLYGTYLWKFEGSDEVLSFYGIRSNSDVAVVGGSTILGNAKIAGARWIIPLPTTPPTTTSYFHSITLGIDRKDFAQTNISLTDQTSTLTVLPAITYYPLSLNYSGTSVQDGQIASVSLGLVTAPRDLFGNTDAKFQSRRVLGGASFVTFKYDASLDETLSRHWGMYGHVAGQWTADPLIPNEQFVTGGAESVRGYRESEISGDRGVNASIEGRLFPLGHPGFDGKRSLYTCAFVDSAQIRLVDPSGPQISITTILSTGIGLHAQGWNGFRLALDGAKALRDGGHGVSGPITKEGTWRIEASLGYSF